MEDLFFYLLGFIMGSLFVALLNGVMNDERGDWD